MLALLMHHLLVSVLLTKKAANGQTDWVEARLRQKKFALRLHRIAIGSLRGQSKATRQYAQWHQVHAAFHYGSLDTLF